MTTPKQLNDRIRLLHIKATLAKVNSCHNASDGKFCSGGSSASNTTSGFASNSEEDFRKAAKSKEPLLKGKWEYKGNGVYEASSDTHSFTIKAKTSTEYVRGGQIRDTTKTKLITDISMQRTPKGKNYTDFAEVFRKTVRGESNRQAHAANRSKAAQIAQERFGITLSEYF